MFQVYVQIFWGRDVHKEVRKKYGSAYKNFQREAFVAVHIWLISPPPVHFKLE